MNKINIFILMLIIHFSIYGLSFAGDDKLQKEHTSVDDIKMIFIKKCRDTSNCPFNEVTEFDNYTRWQANKLQERISRPVSLDELYESSAEIHRQNKNR